MSEASPLNHVIDCDADPFMPEGWTVVQHVRGGSFTFDPSNVELYLDEGQRDGKFIDGYELHKRLANMPVLNANVLGYLLTNQHLIPREWTGKNVSFWGTIYSDAAGIEYVLCLDEREDVWQWRNDPLDHGFGGDAPAALQAN